MKLILVVGARPNFMKALPLLREMNNYNSQTATIKFEVLLVHTGQHYDYDMSQVFFQDLDLPRPYIYLGIGSGSHAEQTGKILIEFEKVLLLERPHLVIVVGDVNSTLSAALAAVKLHIPIAHIEAGLRSFDNEMPEEINRKLTDAISDFLFTHSPEASDNLKREGIASEKIHFVGNVMVDTLLQYREKAMCRDTMATLGLSGGCYALLTLHRPENVDSKQSLSAIVRAIEKISHEIPVVFPLHPRTRKRLQDFRLSRSIPAIETKRNHGKDEGRVHKSSTDVLIGTGEPNQFQSNILIVPPLGYLDFLNLEMNACFVMTDSGGVQEETTVLNIPCLTLRDCTERPVTINHGTNLLVGNNTDTIVRQAYKIIHGSKKIGTMPDLWDGIASQRIIGILAEWGRQF